ncbi:MAG: peptidoglycan-binding protein, partial [Thiotrichales bacterium]|nr:peptidoglycan-binding protein [Thiotrichales bacterium]
MGIKLADGRALPAESMNAKLLLPSDYRGPAFLVYANFDVIKRWNNSNNYALGVAHLADRIVGRNALSKERPDDDEAMSLADMQALQDHLNWLGYDAGKPDGIAGNRTRSALRAFQKDQRLPADGFPSPAMLKRLAQVRTPS